MEEETDRSILSIVTLPFQNILPILFCFYYIPFFKAFLYHSTSRDSILQTLTRTL